MNRTTQRNSPDSAGTTDNSPPSKAAPFSRSATLGTQAGAL
jgi:hypothetical protein